jgi:2-phosphosulfolactate phosphatase
MKLEVLFAPAELTALPRRDLGDTWCVVFDVLRATSTIVTALTNGARAIRPVSTIDQALAERARSPDALLAGERGGWRIGPELTGGITFDLGNSPREFTGDAVAGRTIVMTTTNGTLALEACAGAPVVLAAAFLNLAAVAASILASSPSRVLLVCSGTGERCAYEDALAAGALCDLLVARAELLDSARLALAGWRSVAARYAAEIGEGENGRRLRSCRELAEDVAFCGHRSVFQVVPRRYEGRELRAAPRDFAGQLEAR